MLTRQGLSSVFAGIVAIAVGRVFGVIELFIIGSAFLVAVVFALLFVLLRRPRVSATRWVHPTVLVAGDTGRVDLRLEHLGVIRSTSFELAERVSRANLTDHVARLSIAPLAPGTRSSAGYRLPTTTRGIVRLGPLVLETRDPLGIARSRSTISDLDTVTVAPKTFLMNMPVLGQGPLGRHLAIQARRLGPGEFHGLRQYADGDEPRSIDWKSSARSEHLLVKEHTVEGVRRCTVVFDADPSSYLDSSGFERGVTAAASLVHSSEQAGLTTRFVTAGGIDLRGPETGANTLKVLARIEPSDEPLGILDRDPGEGLGLLILVTGSHRSAGWRSVQAIIDPTLTAIGVTTDERPKSGIGVAARTEDEFLDSWLILNGQSSGGTRATSPDDRQPVGAGGAVMTITDVRPIDRPSSTGWDRTDGPARTPPVERTAGPRPAIDPTVASELIATASLAVFSIAVAAGYARVFAGWQFFDNFIALAVIGHGIGFVLRRLQLSAWLAVPLLAIAITWMIGLFHYRDSYTLLLPTGDTLDLFRSEIELVRQQFNVAVAPVIYGGGWDIIAAIGMGLMIVLSDTFAFRAFARAEALVPGGVLFVFIAALGSDRDRVPLTAAVVAAGVAATVALRAHHAPQRPTAIGRPRSPLRLVVPAAIGTAAVVAITASIVGPRLPGAGDEPLYETRGGSSGSVTEVVSPLVDIRSRLTNRSNTQLFVVDASFESYWRSSALPRFDGTTWGLPERALSSAAGELSTAREGATELFQQIRIVRLGGKFIPSAADPIAASPQDGLRWNADSSTLLKIDGDLEAGDVYEVISASPRFRLEDLQGATSTSPGDPIYLELPDNFPGSVGDLAREVTAGATTPYETALTLQDWFRTEFEYSLEVQAGHNNNAIEGFLRDRVGYCEQFAGTYAAMMRTLGIPARVAVGFTPGNNTGGQTYSVLGKNAHSWPEVWFDGLGWVPFEPTPGRGAPGAENYTNVAPEQDSTGVDPDAPIGEAEPAPDSPIAPPSTLNAPEAPARDLDLDSSDDGAAAPAAAPAESPPGSSPLPILLAVAIVALLVGAPALLRRWRRRRGPTDAVETVVMLWNRSIDAVSEVGAQRHPSQTPMEHAAAAAAQFPVASRPMKSLAAAVTEVAYRPDAATVLQRRDSHGRTQVAECRNWCRQIERAVSDSISPLSRVRRYFTRLD